MLLLETLLSVDGNIRHLHYHEKRVQQSFDSLFRQSPTFSLQNILNPPQNGLFRCRIIYDQTQVSVEYVLYEKRLLERFKILATDHSYAHKYLDRDYFDQNRATFGDFDEIIYIKEDLVTDTSIANIACKIDDRWLTPKTPLLKGTTRQRLLDEQRLIEADITLDMLKNADLLAMMNALTGFYIIKNPILEG